MQTDVRVVSVPTPLTVGVTTVPEGREIELDFRLEAVMDGVLVTGTARTVFAAECSRCLDPLAEEVEADFQELYQYPEQDSGYGHDAEDAVDSDDEDEDYYLEGDLLDLEPVVRDAVVLALPLSPLCQEDCPGLCVDCGARMADVGPDHGHGERIDPRWEALRGLSEEPGER